MQKRQPGGAHGELNVLSGKQENLSLRACGTVRARAEDQKETSGISAMQELTDVESAEVQ